MSWSAYQSHLRAVCLDAEPSPSEVAALGHEPWRWLAYRRMVRARLYQTIDHGFERLIELVGLERFRALVDRFFVESPPRSIYLRDIPCEFLAFFESRYALFTASAPLPPCSLDLARFEWAELDAAYAHEEVRPADVAPLDMNLPAVLSPAHRLLDLSFPVHRADDAKELRVLEASPTQLCVYRDEASYDVRTLELNPLAATMLAAIERRQEPLSGIVRRAAELHGATIDTAFVDALSALLADFMERGLLLGSLADRT